MDPTTRSLLDSGAPSAASQHPRIVALLPRDCDKACSGKIDDDHGTDSSVCAATNNNSFEAFSVSSNAGRAPTPELGCCCTRRGGIAQTLAIVVFTITIKATASSAPHGRCTSSRAALGCGVRDGTSEPALTLAPGSGQALTRRAFPHAQRPARCARATGRMADALRCGEALPRPLLIFGSEFSGFSTIDFESAAGR